jgi:uncharacterized membrane protein
MDRLMPFLATQIWYLPYLALFILGVVFALGRRDMGNASQYAVFGFGLMILGLMLSSANTYFMIARAGGDYDMSAVARNAALFHMGTMVLNLGGWGFILAAIFAKRPPPPSRVE